MKKILFIFLTLFIFNFSINNVYADDDSILVSSHTSSSYNCTSSIFGDPESEGSVAFYLQEGLNFMRYLGVGAFIVLTTVDFIKALTNDDKEMVSKVMKKMGSRFIWVIVLFMAPIIVEYILELVGVYSVCGIE